MCIVTAMTNHTFINIFVTFVCENAVNLFSHLTLCLVQVARLSSSIRELKQRRRRRRERRLVENEFIFYKQNSRLPRFVRYTNGSKNMLRLNKQRQRSIPNENTKNSRRRRPRSVDDAKPGHFTLLFCRGRQRNVQRFITHVHSHCFAR